MEETRWASHTCSAWAGRLRERRDQCPPPISGGVCYIPLPMTLASVLGQPRAVEALRSALKSDTVHHAYLFGGPEGVGKELCAIGFAQALNCLEAPGEGCGECHSCTRIARRNHPDVTWLMPEDEQVSRKLAGRSDFTHTPSRDIRVEQIRKLQDRLSFHALEARKKVAILASAQAMNPQAQNAFLKTLEEPPAETVLILIASAPDKLLPTIRSRCSKVHFGPLPKALLEERVKQVRGLDAATSALVATMGVMCLCGTQARRHAVNSSSRATKASPPGKSGSIT